MSHRHRTDRRLHARALLGLLLAGCGRPLSMFETSSPGAERVARLTWEMTALAAIILVAVLIILVLATRRNRDRNPGDVDLRPRHHGWVIWAGAVIPSLVLVILFVLDTAALKEFPLSHVGGLGTPADGEFIKVTGEQWWWRVEYPGKTLGENVTTANEIHVPVGQTVRIELTSADVIHSFWVPNLHGKLDLIPGDTNELSLTVTRPGRYGGRCAEYCGLQHAHMALVVVAQSPGDYAEWLASQRAPAAEPSDSIARAGEALVVEGACAMCHSIRGTPARATMGPDLTHLASQKTLAAGSFPNTRGYLEAWITNAQSLKPGTRMPSLTQFTGPELQAMTAYLEQLH